ERVGVSRIEGIENRHGDHAGIPGNAGGRLGRINRLRNRARASSRFCSMARKTFSLIEPSSSAAAATALYAALTASGYASNSANSTSSASPSGNAGQASLEQELSTSAQMHSYSTGTRSSLARIASADWVQTNGFGLALCSAR